MTDAPAMGVETAELFARVRGRNPMHYRFMTGALRRVTADEAERLEQYLDFCRGQGCSHDHLADCYLTIVNDTLREQAFFRKNGRYRYSSFAEASEAVYFNAAYMTKYMYGLAISAFLWPNHLDILRFFNATLPTARPGRYLEIGPGHGYFLMTAMRRSAFSEFLAVDISETSIAQTRAIVRRFTPALADKAELARMDFLDCDLPRGAFDAVVMGEVLEHVERPQAFLDRIRVLAADDAHIYVTTCVNAPAVDHIYLFKDTEQVAELFADAGFAIRDQLIRPYEGKTVEENLAARLPINVAYVLEKA
jgi:SAM-dependent methyltransferase